MSLFSSLLVPPCFLTPPSEEESVPRIDQDEDSRILFVPVVYLALVYLYLWFLLLYHVLELFLGRVYTLCLYIKKHPNYSFLDCSKFPLQIGAFLNKDDP